MDAEREALLVRAGRLCRGSPAGGDRGTWCRRGAVLPRRTRSALETVGGADL